MPCTVLIRAVLCKLIYEWLGVPLHYQPGLLPAEVIMQEQFDEGLNPEYWGMQLGTVLSSACGKSLCHAASSPLPPDPSRMAAQARC